MYVSLKIRQRPFICIYIKQIITTNDGITFELNRDNTAHICYSPKARGNIIIPKSVRYQNQEYLIKTIQESAFKNNQSVESIQFSDDSTLLSIQSNSFDNSSIVNISIPSSVENLEEGWIINAQYLKSVIISANNKNFKYADKEHQIIIGKSDKNSDDFDVLIFANRNIEEVKIPCYVKHISSSAFENYIYLTKIEFPENSILQSIGKNAFYGTLIQNIYIPSFVEKLEKGWNTNMKCIKSVSISSNNKISNMQTKNIKLLLEKVTKIQTISMFLFLQIEIFKQQQFHHR